MATVGETYGFSEEYIENFQVKVIIGGSLDEGAIVQITSPLMGVFNLTTGADGLTNSIFLPSSETLSISVESINNEVEETFVYNYSYNSYLTEFEAILSLPPSLGDSENVGFIRWHSSSALYIQGGQLGTINDSLIFTPLDVGVCSLFEKGDEINNRYRRSKKKYLPPFFEGDNIQQILNFNVDFGADDFNDIEVAIINNSGLVISSGITLNKTTCDLIDSYYLDFTYPSAKSSSNYFVVYNTVTEVVYYISNEFRSSSNDDKSNYPILSYRNSCDVFNNAYECLTGIRNIIRIDFNVIEQQPDISLEQYRSKTSGKMRNLKTETAKVVNVESYFFDDGANNAMLALSIHDDIEINGKTYEVKTAHTVETNKINSRQKGVIELYDQEFSTVNK